MTRAYKIDVRMLQLIGNVNLSVASATALLLGEPLAMINFYAENIILVSKLCIAKASPNRRGADGGGGEVNVFFGYLINFDGVNMK